MFTFIKSYFRKLNGWKYREFEGSILKEWEELGRHFRCIIKKNEKVKILNIFLKTFSRSVLFVKFIDKLVYCLYLKSLFVTKTVESGYSLYFEKFILNMMSTKTIEFLIRVS